MLFCLHFKVHVTTPVTIILLVETADQVMDGHKAKDSKNSNLFLLVLELCLLCIELIIEVLGMGIKVHVRTCITFRDDCSTCMKIV